MPKFLVRRWHGFHMIAAAVLSALFILIIFFYEWVIGVLALIPFGGLIYYIVKAEKAFQRDLKEYILTLSHRVKKAGSGAIQHLPIGMVLYNEEKRIEWHNSYMAALLGKESAVGEDFEQQFPMLNLDKAEQEIHYKGQHYRVLNNSDERLVYFTNITAYKNLLNEYEASKLAIGIVMLDNLDEATQGLNDQDRSMMLAKVVGAITEWAHEYNLFLRRTDADKFMILMRQPVLQKLEQSRFEILDEVRDMTIEHKLPLTLSIGVGADADTLHELGALAQTSLDIALGRGGDQAAVKRGEKITFYGGRTNAVEKGTRVKARVISHALKELVKESDKVIVMGHRFPDMDSLGACIGILKAAQMSEKEGYIVLEHVNPSIERMMEQVRKNENLHKWFVTPEQALEIVTSRTLAVVVDTHKKSLVEEPKLLHHVERIFVLDHHRRGAEFIDDATLVYIEPYASSACELVTELLQYYQERVTMSAFEATAVLAGIVVDTKNFALRTGARTFEAASYLRRHGADTSLIQRWLKEDLHTFIQRAEMIRNAEILYNHIAICVTEPGKSYSQLMIARAADTLLNMTDIKASFVISEREDGLVGISARSMGDVNVQLIMERMGGGGHLSNAAVQLDCSLEEAEAQLKQTIEQYHEEEGLFE